MWYSHVYQTKIQVNKDLKTLHSKRIAQELKRLCGNAYRPRKFDLEVRGVNTNNILNLPPQVQKFQPLSQLQSFPPYFDFKNQPNPLLLNQAQHESQNTSYQMPMGHLRNFNTDKQFPSTFLPSQPIQFHPKNNESHPCHPRYLQMVPQHNLGQVNS